MCEGQLRRLEIAWFFHPIAARVLFVCLLVCFSYWCYFERGVSLDNRGLVHDDSMCYDAWLLLLSAATL